MIATANNDVRPPGYPADRRRLPPAGAARPDRRALTERDSHDVASMQAIQRDTCRSPSTRCSRSAEAHPGDDDQREVLDRLARWNGDVAARSQEAALYELWVSAIMRRLVGERIGEELYRAYSGFREIFVAETLPAMLAHSTDRVDPEALRAALADAIEEADGRTWGEVNALVLAHPLAGSRDSRRCSPRPPSTPTGRRIDDLPGCDGRAPRPAAPRDPVVSGGLGPGRPRAERRRRAERVSGNPASPHWADQSRLFEAGEARRRVSHSGRGNAHPATLRVPSSLDA
jgi:acyl-homoserine lactone acylase PvdQ